MYIRIQHKHTRCIDDDDRYFVVTMESKAGISNIGWIEKEFVLKDFLKNIDKAMPKPFNIFKGDVKNVKEYSKEDYYKQKNK